MTSAVIASLSMLCLFGCCLCAVFCIAAFGRTEDVGAAPCDDDELSREVLFPKAPSRVELFAIGIVATCGWLGP